MRLRRRMGVIFPARRELAQSAVWTFFTVLPRADRILTVIWWSLIVLRGAVPAAFGVAVGYTVAKITAGASLVAPLTLLAACFVAMQVLTPILNQVGESLGDKLAMWLYDRILRAAVAPAGVAHLESPAIADDLAMARDFDQGMSGPPLSVSLSITANGLVLMATGVAQVVLLSGFSWWAPLLTGGAWASTHWLLKESTVWDRSQGEVRLAERHADYAYHLSVDAFPAKEVRVFGLTDWIVDRFAVSRRKLVTARLSQTRLRRRPLGRALVILLLANGLTVWSIATAATAGRISPAELVVFGQAIVGASLIAFGGLNWALPIAADSVALILSLDESMAAAGRLVSGAQPAEEMPSRDVVFRNVSFTYPGQAHAVLRHLNLTIPARTSLAVVGLNGEGKTTLIKLLCRLYDPDSGSIEVDGRDLRTIDINSWRRKITVLFQDYARYELPLRDNVAPLGAPEELIRSALEAAGGTELPSLDTVLMPGYEDATSLSGGQWQRVALARAFAAVRQGAEIVILDEPTAQLDVRGEAEFYDRLLAAAGDCTAVLISHRFATVRHADKICVLDRGEIAEMGSHDELMARRGRYWELFELQASRYTDEEANA